MWDIVLIWLVSAVSVVGIIYMLKSARRRRFAGLANFHWPGTIVIALIIGAFPAFIFYNQSPRVVEVPEGVAERPNISQIAKNK